jgi:diaminohydroxyphosphoribosylaminopyrimidine deaminase/5-amino-6-(5-phosphoribosylamino)uracil reductase
MTAALDLARRGEGLTRPNPPVGAVIVRQRRVVGRGFHRQAGGPHAELLALQDAGRRAAGATLYVTLEPCSSWGRTPPCTDAILRSGLRRVVIGVTDRNPKHSGRGLAILRRNGVDADAGICGAEAARLYAPFFRWITARRPYVTLKIGMSVDGRIADLHRRSRWITDLAARRQVQKLRRRCDAVMIGVGTALQDDPSLLPRPAYGRKLYRIIVDSAGRLPLQARVLRAGAAAQTVIATTPRCAPRRIREYTALGAQVWVLPSSAQGRVDLRPLLRRAAQCGLLHVVCEGGSELAASLIRARLVDEFMLFIAPRILGGHAAVPAVGGRGWPLQRSPYLRFAECRPCGDGILLQCFPAKSPAGLAR